MTYRVVTWYGKHSMSRRPRKARLSRKERARREAISKGLQRHWRRVREVQKATAQTTKQARQVVKKIEPGKYRATLDRLRKQREAHAFKREEVAFNLQDRDKLRGFNLYDKFKDQEKVRVHVKFEYKEDAGDEPERGDRVLEFDPGESEEDFWSNYYEAIRDYHDDVLETYGDGDSDYEGFAYFVASMA